MPGDTGFNRPHGMGRMEHEVKNKIRLVKNMVLGTLVFLAGLMATWLVGEPAIMLVAVIAAGAVVMRPRFEPGDAVLAMVGGEWAPAWVIGTMDEVVCVEFDGSWGKGRVHVPAADCILL